MATGFERSAPTRIRGPESMLTDEQISTIRSRFPILHEKTYLYNCSQGALSDAAETGMQAYVESWRTSNAPWNDWMAAYDGVRAQFARFVNAEPDEIAILTSASAGINAIASSLDFAQRTKVVMGEYEFPTMGQIWLAQQKRGAQIEFIEGAGNTIDLEAYERSIDQHTAIVPLTQVSGPISPPSPVLPTLEALSSSLTAIRIAARAPST
jgi:selenocysteine lyase/cysteine desulfurase